MKKSKWNSKKLGHYRPLEDCRIPEETFMGICVECNKCHRFNSIARRKSRVKKKYGIDYRHIGKQFYPLPREWRRWSTYTTEKQRDQALKILQGKDYCGIQFEFRKSEK